MENQKVTALIIDGELRLEVDTNQGFVNHKVQGVPIQGEFTVDATSVAKLLAGLNEQTVSVYEHWNTESRTTIFVRKGIGDEEFLQGLQKERDMESKEHTKKCLRSDITFYIALAAAVVNVMLWFV